MKRLVKIFFLFSLSLSVTNEAFSQQIPKSNLTRTNSEGPVSISVTFLNPSAQEEYKDLAFEITMNTHSVNLDAYKLDKLAILKDDRGNEYKAISWEPSGGGHHISGTIKFPLTDKAKKHIVNTKTKFIELVINDVGNVKTRTFKWSFPLK